MSRLLRRLAAAFWFFGGGLWVLLTLMLWLSNPEGDVDREPSGQLFAASLVLWLVLGVGVIALIQRRSRA